jgi:HD-GYP domain-containing protein (c-di-GMP phosphodiesterase class II)
VSKLISPVLAVANRFEVCDSVVQKLSAAVESKDRSTAWHSERVTQLARLIAEVFDPDWTLDSELYGFALHDVGKVAIPADILFKPSSLTSFEWEIMRSHPEIGSRMIAPAGLGREAHEIVLHHHERWDGAGYPLGLAGRDIPLSARLFAVADSYDAMTSDRPYRAALAADVALAELQRESGQQFDPEAVEAFMEVALA